MMNMNAVSVHVGIHNTGLQILPHCSFQQFWNQKSVFEVITHQKWRIYLTFDILNLSNWYTKLTLYINFVHTQSEIK